MKSKTDDRYIIPCLAVVDMFACGLGVSFGTMMNFNPLNFRKGVICKLIWSANKFTATSSGLMLLAIAVQRYIKISRLSNSSMSLRRKRLTITAIIIVSIVISLPCFVLYGEAKVPLKSENRTITGYNCGALPNVNRDFLFGYSVILLLLCLAGIFALIAIYCVLLRIIYKQESFLKRNWSALRSVGVNVHHSIANQIMKDSDSTNCGDAKSSVDKSESHNTDNQSTSTSYQKDDTNGGFDIKGHRSTVPSGIQPRRTSKLTKILCRIKRKHRFSIMFFLITLLFSISYFPRTALMIVESVISNFWDKLADAEYVIVLCFYRGYLTNNVVNPVIYLIFDTVFRTSCKQLCCRHR
ncbi:alpha-2 adrenergic receptor-like [Mytilus californianus]|uniref:alpha-2 adrenergic receptor-like n=1 Tax=Mytilus californianus TaxID=6549 RepID=UPI00224692D2|nr:alpha-2 adrenergic receptor-like [Mytilus californianus]